MGARRKHTLIDLFCGAGGFTQGFVTSGFTPIFANDYDHWSCETYRENFGDHVREGTIQAVKDFPTVDVVIGGPPCQGFSNLGQRLPNDPRNQLWRHYMRAVKQAHPKIFVMENVPPLLKSEEFAEIRREADQLGYTVVAAVLNAADYGVPQTRKRAIVLGSRVGTPKLPMPTHFDPVSDRPGSGRAPWRTVQDAFTGIPRKPTRNGDTDGTNTPLSGELLHISRNPRPLSLKRYRLIPEGGNRFDLQRKAPDLTPGCWIRKRSGGTDLFGRLWWERPAFTIRTEFFKPEKGRYLHPSEHRPITHWEAARIQTFPDRFRFRGPKIEIAKQIGNAVPVSLAEAIAHEVFRLLRK